jgi:hypothetical protein
MERVNVLMKHLTGISGRGDSDSKNATGLCRYITYNVPLLNYTITNHGFDGKLERGSIFHYCGDFTKGKMVLNDGRLLNLAILTECSFVVLDLRVLETFDRSLIKNNKYHYMICCGDKSYNFILSRFLGTPLECFYEFGMNKKCTLEGFYYLHGSAKSNAHLKLMKILSKFVKYEFDSESIRNFYSALFLFELCQNAKRSCRIYSNPRLPRSDHPKNTLKEIILEFLT